MDLSVSCGRLKQARIELCSGSTGGLIANDHIFFVFTRAAIVLHRIPEEVDAGDFYLDGIAASLIGMVKHVVNGEPVAAALDGRIDIPAVDPDRGGAVPGACSSSAFFGGRSLDVPGGETEEVAAFAGVVQVYGSCERRCVFFIALG